MDPSSSSDVVMAEVPDHSTPPPAAASRKRKTASAPSTSEAVAAHATKKSRKEKKGTANSDSDKLSLLYIGNLPSSQLRRSALLVGFNRVQHAQSLYDMLFGDEDVDQMTDDQVGEIIESFLNRAVEITPYKKGLHVVTDGPPSLPSTKEPEDARVKPKPLRVFIASKFASQALYPEVAVIVDESQDAAKRSLNAFTAGTFDNRPVGVKDAYQEVPLTAPGFYLLSNGEFYDWVNQKGRK